MAVYLLHGGKKVHIDVTSSVSVTISPSAARSLGLRILNCVNSLDEGPCAPLTKALRTKGHVARLAHALATQKRGAF